MISARSIIESLSRVAIHVFFLISIIFVLQSITAIDESYIVATDCSAIENTTVRDTCHTTLYSPTKTNGATHANIKKKKIRVFGQCFAGRHIYRDSLEYNYLDHLTNDVRRIGIAAVVFLSIQVVVALAWYVYGVSKGTKHSETAFYRNPTVTWAMTILSVVTALLVAATLITFFFTIATRTDCGWGRDEGKLFRADSPPAGKTEHAFEKAKCAAFGTAMRAYSDSFDPDTGYTAGTTTTAYTDLAKVYKSVSEDTKVDDRYKYKKAASTDKQRDISSVALSHYVMNCGHEKGDPKFQYKGVSGATGIAKYSDYEPRNDLLDKLDRIYTKINQASWLLSFGAMMLFFSSFSVSQMIKSTQRNFKKVNIVLSAIGAVALILVSIGLFQLFQASGDAKREHANSHEDCGVDPDAFSNNDFVYQKDSEQNIEKGMETSAVASLVFSLVVAVLGGMIVIHEMGRRANKRRGMASGNTRDQIQDDPETMAKIDTYQMHATKYIVGLVILGLLAAFILQRVFASFKYQAANVCELSSVEMEMLQVNGAVGALVGTITLLSVAFVHLHFGHNGINSSQGWAFNHWGSPKQFKKGDSLAVTMNPASQDEAAEAAGAIVE